MFLRPPCPRFKRKEEGEERKMPSTPPPPHSLQSFLRRRWEMLDPLTLRRPPLCDDRVLTEARPRSVTAPKFDLESQSKRREGRSGALFAGAFEAAFVEWGLGNLA